MPYTKDFGKPGTTLNIGIKPTKEDHEFVHSMSLMGLGVRPICTALGERFKLGKPMSRMTMYWHFKKDLIKRPRGRAPSAATLKRRFEDDITAGMRQLIAEAEARRKTKGPR